jgi:flavin-dependent dehydrogenase
MEGSKVVGVKGLVNGKEQVFKAKVVVGADGAGGMTSRKLNAYHNEEDHLCAGIRCYYENVGGMIDQIELHFVKEALPGYFWIFPLPNGKANVGIGMIVTDMKKKKVNLQKVMFDIIENNPTFKDRFKNAKRTTEVKSWLLPFASKRVKMSGDGYLLVGDAASLIDPFTGEGIGNALTSGRAASAAIVEALNKNDFSASSLKKYEDLLMADIEKEVKDNYKLQKMVKGEFLLNLIVGRAKKSKYVQGVISNALINPDEHSTLSDPLFFFKALFAP